MFDKRVFNRARNCDTRDRDEVVSASVSDAWESVHLGVDPDGASTVPVGVLRFPGCVHEMMFLD